LAEKGKASKKESLRKGRNLCVGRIIREGVGVAGGTLSGENGVSWREIQKGERKGSGQRVGTWSAAESAKPREREFAGALEKFWGGEGSRLNRWGGVVALILSLHGGTRCGKKLKGRGTDAKRPTGGLFLREPLIEESSHRGWRGGIGEKRGGSGS